MQRVFRSFESRAFTVDVLRAQFNRPRFLYNSGMELMTIASCCELASAALDEVSLLRMDDEGMSPLCSSRPLSRPLSTALCRHLVQAYIEAPIYSPI